MEKKLKQLEKEMNFLCDKAASLCESAFTFDGSTIKINRKTKQEYQLLQQTIQDKLEEYNRLYDEYIEEGLRGGVLEWREVEIVGLLSPILNGQRLYKRILIKLH